MALCCVCLVHGLENELFIGVRVVSVIVFSRESMCLLFRSKGPMSSPRHNASNIDDSTQHQHLTNAPSRVPCSVHPSPRPPKKKQKKKLEGMEIHTLPLSR